MKPLFPNFLTRMTFFFLFFVSATVGSGQVADFSGNWKLNPSKSKLNEQFSMAPKELILVQSGNTLSVERHSEFQDQKFIIKDKFTLDGQECINDGWQGSKKKSVAIWAEDKKSLVIKTKFPLENGGELNISETFKLDGPVLLIETSSTSDWGTSTETYGFDKQQ
jgi:hypothetical protein